MMNLEDIINLFSTEEILDVLVSNPEFLKRIHKQNSDDMVDYITRNSTKYYQMMLDARKDVQLSFYNRDKAHIEELLKSEHTIPDALRCIYEAGDMETKAKVKEHPNCSKAILEDGIDWNYCMEQERFRKESIAKLKSANCTADDIRYITKVANEAHPALDAVSHAKCPEDVLRKYAKSKNQLFLLAVIEHPRTPFDVLQDLSENENEHIREASRAAMERFKDDD